MWLMSILEPCHTARAAHGTRGIFTAGYCVYCWLLCSYLAKCPINDVRVLLARRYSIFEKLRRAQCKDKNLRFSNLYHDPTHLVSEGAA